LALANHDPSPSSSKSIQFIRTLKTIMAELHTKSTIAR
jgi:hypothetical protein